MQTDQQKKQFFIEIHNRNLEHFQSSCPDGYSTRIDENGICIYVEAQQAMMIRHRQVICLICGTSVKANVRDMVSSALDHIEMCHERYVSSFTTDLCTVCDMHWLEAKCVPRPNTCEHASSYFHKQQMQKANDVGFFNYEDRQGRDEEILEKEKARLFLVNEKLDDAAKNIYVKASVELVLMTPPYDLQGEYRAQKRALEAILGSFNHRTIMQLISVLAKYGITADQIFAETYGYAGDDFDAPVIPGSRRE